MNEYRDVSKSSLLCIDIETYDPGISEGLGAGVYRNDGYILGVAISDDEGNAEYFNLGHPDCKHQLRDTNIKYLRWALSLPMPKLGTNIKYDVDWLENWVGDASKGFRWEGPKFEVKGLLYDIQVAEPLIDENQGHYSLDFQANKYLGRGKYKTEIDEYCEANGWKGDPRQYLYRMPYRLVEKYALEDVREPVEIFKIQWKIMEEEKLIDVFMLETDLLRATLDMRREGAPLDVNLRNENAYLAKSLLEERQEDFSRKHGNINFNSTKQLKELFDSFGIEYPYKLVYVNARGKQLTEVVSNSEAQDILKYMDGDTKGTEATVYDITGGRHKELVSCRPTIGKDFFDNIDKMFEVVDEETESTNEMLKDILFMRKADKMLGTFLQGSYKTFLCPDGKIHPTIHSVRNDTNGTRSGRFSMSEPNLQQIPSTSRDKYWGKLCRAPFVPLPNCWWVKIDYSQVEYRVLAHYATGPGSKELVERYRLDPHTDYHQYIMDLTSLSRSFAKNLNFGCMYGMGKKKMSRLFGWSSEYAEEIMNVYHGRAPYIKYTMDSVANVAASRGFIRTISGRRSRLIDKDKTYVMLNRLIQGTAADIAKKAMVDIYKSGYLDIVKWHVTVHDEYNFSVPKTAEGIRAIMAIQDIMENTYNLKVPIKAELEIGSSWADVKKLDFVDIYESRERWIANITDENVQSEVARITKMCEEADAKKKAAKQSPKV